MVPTFKEFKIFWVQWRQRPSQRLVKEPYDKWDDLGAIEVIGNIDGDRKD